MIGINVLDFVEHTCNKNDKDHYFSLQRRIIVFKLFSKTVQLSNFRVEISVQKSEYQYLPEQINVLIERGNARPRQQLDFLIY